MYDLEIADPVAVKTPKRQVDPKVGLRIAIAFLPLRLFLAGGWLRATAEKVTDPAWWNGDMLIQFVQEQRAEALPFFVPILSDVILPNVVLVSVLVVISQALVGLALAVGRHLQPALRIGIAMNVIFVLSGSVNPSVFYLVMEIGLLYAVASGWIGQRPTVSERSPLLVAGGWLVLGLFLARWIQTIEPALVIEDPAMVLAFLCVILAIASVVKWINARTHVSELDSNPGSRAVRSWLLCRAVDQPQN